MAMVLKEISTITAKGQTTVPKSVRQALGVNHGDQIAFYVDDERGVTVRREEAADADPVIDNFLTFLAKDMQARPEALTIFPQPLADRIAKLVEGMDVDPDATIEGEVDL